METYPDLFEDGETPTSTNKSKGWVQDKKRRMGYHEARDGEPRCKNCKHLIKTTFHNRNYYKCELIGISRSEATDIRLKDTCKKFEEDTDGNT